MKMCRTQKQIPFGKDQLIEKRNGRHLSLLRNAAVLFERALPSGSVLRFRVWLDHAGVSWRVNFAAPRTLIIRFRL